MSILRNILLLPVHIIALFTGAKSFRANPILGSSILNRMGLHVVRYLMAHLVIQFRWFLLSPLAPKAQRQQFHEQGYILADNFLSADELSAITEELKQFNSPTRRLAQGDTFTERALLHDSMLDTYPALISAARLKRLKNLFSYANGRWRRPLMYLQRIKNGARTGHNDPQKTVHSDTFHPTVKAWLFLEDVTLDKGPFSYAPGTHKLTWARLKFEYQRSIIARNMPDGYSEKGSFRADNEQLKSLGMQPATPVTVKAGTLVIANTHGFHGRSSAESGATRLELWGFSRPNPFNPWPGIGLDFWTNVEEWALERIWKLRDNQAAKKGKKASWHPINSHDMLGDLLQPTEKKTDSKAS